MQAKNFSHARVRGQVFPQVIFGLHIMQLFDQFIFGVYGKLPIFETATVSSRILDRLESQPSKATERYNDNDAFTA